MQAQPVLLIYDVFACSYLTPVHTFERRTTFLKDMFTLTNGSFCPWELISRRFRYHFSDSYLCLAVLFHSGLSTMRDKSVETFSFQRVFWCMLFNYYGSHKKLPPPPPLPPNNVGFPIAQMMGFAAVQH